ncbi:MAG: Calcineurin-like phosphoesterase [Firmicutes bacterium ADurb.Bin300]|jgi:hypothetical protein|nr:MAG: Calcineurin-like phosphoesterase [Firmicutes bacterium ADurb.Bin300]HOD02850.1 metallophosphoesterase [Clostridiales bacterium]
MKIKKILKKIGIILLKVFTVLLGIIAAFCAVTAVVNSVLIRKNLEFAQSFDLVSYDETSRLRPLKDDNGDTVFITDRDFKILQLTDIHLGGGFLSYKKDRAALNAVASMVTREKPDLVIITGDIAYPTPQAMTLNNKNGAKLMAALMEKLGAYWTVVLGNHDTEAYSYYSRNTIGTFYEDSSLKYCLFQKGPENVDGIGNYIINIKNTKGLITQSLIMLDSHSYTDKDYFGVFWKYDNLHKNQIDWYKSRVLEMTQLNNTLKQDKGEDTEPYVSSLCFLHIPLTEYLDAYNEYCDSGLKDTENTEYIHGKIGESGRLVYCGVNDDEFFESLTGTKAVFCGHDHLNNIALKYKGVMLCYGMSVDYLAYIGISSKGEQRGCTVITSKTNSEITVVNENYYQDKYVSKYAKETVEF